MTNPNHEAIRQLHEAFNREDRSLLFALLDADVEWDFSARLIDPGVHHGHAGVEYFLREMDEAWEDFHSEVEELFGSGEEVVAFVRVSGRGRASGAEMNVQVAQTFRLKAGRIVSSRYYGNRADAMRAAGLQE